MKEKSEKYSLFDIFIITFLIYLSGNPFFRMIFFKQSVVCLFILSFIYFIYRRSKMSAISNKEINLLTLVLIIISSIIITFVLNGDDKFSTYFSIILQFCSVFLCSLSIKYNDLIRIFIKIMIFLSIASLIFFAIQLINPSISYIFPQYQGNFQIYSNAFLYNYMLFNDSGQLFLMNRNTGIFWEPGCYQAFLNVALFFYINTCKKEEQYLKPKNLIIVFLFIVTILTTKSTTGYACLAIILLMNVKFVFSSILHNKKIISTFIVSVTIIILIVVYKNNLGSLIQDTFIKISSKDYMKGNGIIERLALNKFKYLFTENKIHFFGISYHTLYSVYSESNIWNSILEDTICLGYTFTAILLYGYIRLSKQLGIQGITLFIVFILSFSTEALFRSPLFLLLSFSGIIYTNDQIKKQNNE